MMHPSKFHQFAITISTFFTPSSYEDAGRIGVAAGRPPAPSCCHIFHLTDLSIQESGIRKQPSCDFSEVPIQEPALGLILFFCMKMVI